MSETKVQSYKVTLIFPGSNRFEAIQKLGISDEGQIVEGGDTMLLPYQDLFLGITPLFGFGEKGDEIFPLLVEEVRGDLEECKAYLKLPILCREEHIEGEVNYTKRTKLNSVTSFTVRDALRSDSEELYKRAMAITALPEIMLNDPFKSIHSSAKGVNYSEGNLEEMPYYYIKGGTLEQALWRLLDLRIMKDEILRLPPPPWEVKKE